MASRLLPRSALTASIAARMLPTLERDAQALSETAQLRGVSLRTGRWRIRARTAGALAVPLVGSALERSLDVAEAMAARGYGAGPRTRMAEEPSTRTDLLTTALCLPLLILAGLAVSGRLGRYAFYPTMDPLATLPALLAAGTAATVIGAVATGLRR